MEVKSSFDVRSNIETFKQATALAIQKVARVVLLRVSKVEVLFFDDYVFVSFKIYARSKFYGDVLIPKDDLTLNGIFFVVQL